MGKREQTHAKKSSPGFVVNRYAKGAPEGSHQPKLPAPSVSKTQERQLEKFGKLAETVKATGSTFGIRKSEIMLAINEGNIDHAISVFRRQAYSTIVTLIPIAEREYKKSKRDHQAYVLNALITQGRELAADLMADGDRSQLAEKILSEVLEPVFKGILQNVVAEMQQIKFMLSDKLKPEHSVNVSTEIDASLRKIAGTMSDLYGTASTQTRRHLLGD